MRISDWSSDVCSSDLAQAHLDKQRDSELKRVGWAVWRIPASALDDTARVGQEGLALIESLGYAAPQGARDAAATSMFWAATALSRIQVLVLETLLAGVVSAEGPVDLSVEDHDMRVAGLAPRSDERRVGQECV